ncbi:peptidylprolyl isomerase [Ohtaekwangia sp.]|uniref:peptidylprolyl isomerase n=1 Tax=Ohtaekwangia sp. TaxID=2066019 RepID=UPI002FDEE336
MMIRFAILALLCSATITSGFAQGKKQKSPKKLNIFTVNKQPVTTEEFIYLYKKNHQNKTEDFTKEKIEEYLNLFINFKLKVEEAKKRGYDTTKAFAKEFNQYKSELQKPYLPDSKLTDSLVRLTYDRMKEEIRASHILINVKPDASPEDTLKAYNKIMEIRNKIVSGQEDFANAAAQYSEDPSAKMNLGNLGYFTAMQMVYPFESAAYNTRIGEISQPVRTRFGYHIIYVADRRPARGEVEVSHIMIRTGDNKDNEKAKNTIFDIYDELRAGVKWDDLCKQYSEDPGSKDNGGRLRQFGVGTMASIPEFERVAFSLTKPGEISDPFQTQYGWHIMRLERKIPLASFEDLNASLKNKVNRDERVQVSKQVLATKLRKQFQFTEQSAVKEKVLALADTSLQKGRWKAPEYPNASKEILYSLNSKQYTVKDFLEYAQKNQKINSQPPAKYLEDLYNHFVDANILALQEEKIMHENPEYTYLLKEYYEGILLFEIMEKEVWNKASEDSVGQHRYYDAHTADYKAGERARASFYFTASNGFMEELRPLLQAGDEKKIQEFVAQHKLKTESGFYKKEEKTILQKVPWASGIYSVENNGMYYLAWLKDILPPGNMSFEEARPAVISDYQNYLEKNWVEQLKKKYPVKVNEKGKQYILQNLQQK